MLAMIKGRPLAAASAAIKRGFKVERFINQDFKWDTLTLRISGDFGDLVKWYCEEDKIIDGYGYPDGTLLFYNEE